MKVKSSPVCGAKKQDGGRCRRLVNKQGEKCRYHIAERPALKPQTVDPGQYIDVRSETRPEIVHHVYTGDSVNSFHCTCEAFHHGTRERDVLFTCKHIDLVVFGKGMS